MDCPRLENNPGTLARYGGLFAVRWCDVDLQGGPQSEFVVNRYRRPDQNLHKRF